MAGLLSRLGRKKSVHIWSAVVVAAGSARRMEGIDKVLATLGELPVLVHTLRVFQQCPDIAEIVVVTREDLMVEVGSICQDFALTKVSKVIKGGKERIHSVQAGLSEVREDAELIAIHDGARPLVSQELIERVIQGANEHISAVPAIPSTDTLKMVDSEGVIIGPVNRDTVVRVQTPQVFDADIIKGALTKAVQKRLTVTDDCSAVDMMGFSTYTVEGDTGNIKLTLPEDMVLAEAILKSRGE